jgi:hypothetical protein
MAVGQLRNRIRFLVRPMQGERLFLAMHLNDRVSQWPSMKTSPQSGVQAERAEMNAEGEGVGEVNMPKAIGWCDTGSRKPRVPAMKQLRGNVLAIRAYEWHTATLPMKKGLAAICRKSLTCLSAEGGT